MAHRKKQRKGAATVEFAIALPILLFFIFSGIEFARVNMIRNTATNAAYEGARKGIVPGATTGECLATCNQTLALLSLNGAAVSAVPATILPDTEFVTVTVSVPINSSNSFVTPRFYMGKSINASITLPRERKF